MKSKDFTVKVERTIQGTPAEVYSCWLNPKVPGNPWYEGKKIILNPKVDGLFYWFISDYAHYGRFIKLERGRRIKHTWMSPATEGRESIVNVTFKKKGSATIMTLVHSGLPNNAEGRGHEEGWSYFLDKLVKRFK